MVLARLGYEFISGDNLNDNAFDDQVGQTSTFLLAGQTEYTETNRKQQKSIVPPLSVGA